MPAILDLSWHTTGVLVAYSAAIVLASTFGGMLPEWIRLTHNRMQLLISFVGGVMLGIAIFHMVPHSFAALGPNGIDQITWGVALGLLVTFFLLRFFHFHQHGPADFGILVDEASSSEHEHTHICSHHNHPAQHRGEHDHAERHHCQSESKSETRWVAVLVGLGLHTLLDGVALGAGVAAEQSHGHTLLPGFGIFLAVLLHKPLDAVSITSLMHPVTSPNKRLLVNLSFAAMCPVGAFLFLFGTGLNGNWSTTLAGCGLAFSAGVFLCISLSDLLPEMEFHSHNRVRLSVALLLGILAAWSIGWFEGANAHHHLPPAHESQEDESKEFPAPQGDSSVLVQPVPATAMLAGKPADDCMAIHKPS